MNVFETPLPGVLRVEPRVFPDERGSFVEAYKAPAYAAAGINYTFVQDNVSVSKRNVLRGLHLQHPSGQAKLVFVAYGEVFDVCVDVRVGSPTFGQWHSEILSAANAHQLVIPVGFAHGFCVLSDEAHFVYKCSDVYRADAQISVAWDEPEIGVNWPIKNPLLSPKDAEALPLGELMPILPRYEES